MRTEILTNLERRANEVLAELKRDGKPILITQHGVPRAVLVDVESYERLQQRVAILEGLVRGEAAAERRHASSTEGAAPVVRRPKEHGTVGQCAPTSLRPANQHGADGER
jgi:prevent-host-death family protein